MGPSDFPKVESTLIKHYPQSTPIYLLRCGRAALDFCSSPPICFGHFGLCLHYFASQIAQSDRLNTFEAQRQNVRLDSSLSFWFLLFVC